MIVLFLPKTQLQLVNQHQHQQHILHQFQVNLWDQQDQVDQVDHRDLVDREVEQVDQLDQEVEQEFPDLGVVVDLEVDGETFLSEDIVLEVEEVGLGIQEVVVDVRVEDIQVVVGDVGVDLGDHVSLVEETNQVVDGHFRNQAVEVFIVHVVGLYL